MTNMCIIRFAQMSDLPIIDEINRQCLSENYSLDMWIYLLRSGYICVATINDKIIGYISVAELFDENIQGRSLEFSQTIETNNQTIKTSNQLSLVFVVSFAVLESYRNQKIGNLLLARALEKSELFYKKKSIVLNVRVSNVSAQHLYKKYGFKIFKEPEQDYYDNPTEDAYLMCLKK